MKTAGRRVRPSGRPIEVARLGAAREELHDGCGSRLRARPEGLAEDAVDVARRGLAERGSQAARARRRACGGKEISSPRVHPTCTYIGRHVGQCR